MERPDSLRDSQRAAEEAKARDGNLPELGPAWEPAEILPVEFRPAPSVLDRSEVQHGFAQRYAESRKKRDV